MVVLPVPVRKYIPVVVIPVPVRKYIPVVVIPVPVEVSISRIDKTVMYLTVYAAVKTGPDSFDISE